MRPEVKKYLREAGYKFPAMNEHNDGVRGVSQEVEPVPESAVIRFEPDPLAEAYAGGTIAIREVDENPVPVLPVEEVQVCGRKTNVEAKSEAQEWVVRIQNYLDRVDWVRRWRMGQSELGMPRVAGYPPEVYAQMLRGAKELMADRQYVIRWVLFCLSWQRIWSEGLMSKFIVDQAMHGSLCKIVAERPLPGVERRIKEDAVNPVLETVPA